MKSKKPGKRTSKVEVLNISRFGIWLYVEGREYFLPYEGYPWFSNAAISAVQNVQLLHQSHLYRPDLDMDLDLHALNSPAAYPLVYSAS